MAAKQTAPRNKEQSKQRFLDTVGEILRFEGFAALKVNYIAEKAGLDKKLIYKYFGGTDALIDAYLKSVDFWSNVNAENPIAAEVKDGGEQLSINVLLSQFDSIAEGQELKKVLLWGLSETRLPLQKIHDAREAIGEQLFQNITDPFFGSNAKQFRAISALLVAGIYYLDLFPGINGNLFCGIDMSQEEGRTEIKKALAKVIQLVYQDQVPS